MAARMAAGGWAGVRNEQKFERESIDQDIKLFSLEIIIAAAPIQHEERPSNRTVEVDRPGMRLSGNAGDEQETGGKLPESADEGALGGGLKCIQRLPTGRGGAEASERRRRVEIAKCRGGDGRSGHSRS